MKKLSRTTEVMIPKNQKYQKYFWTDVQVECQQYPIQSKLHGLKMQPAENIATFDMEDMYPSSVLKDMFANKLITFST